jgi:hypothetical protein
MLLAVEIPLASAICAIFGRAETPVILGDGPTPKLGRYCL